MKRRRKTSGPYSSPPEELARAKHFLIEMLGAGPRGSKEVTAAAAKHGIAHMVYFHARKELGIKAEAVRPSGYSGILRWELSLPAAILAKLPRQEAPAGQKPAAATNGTHELIQAVAAQTTQLETEIAALQQQHAALEAALAAKKQRLEGLLQADTARRTAETKLRSLLKPDGSPQL